MYFDKVATVYRLQPNASDTDKEQYAPVGNLSRVAINLQPASAEVIALNEGQAGRTFTGFVSVSGILIGDQITISGSNQKLIVKGVEEWYFSPIPHLELVLFKGDN